jgi:hypothetical protein
MQPDLPDIPCKMGSNPININKIIVLANFFAISLFQYQFLIFCINFHATGCIVSG